MIAPAALGGGDRTVSVVIPAYKAASTIRRAVDSVLEQPGVEASVIVVIDGLLDETADRLRDYDPARVQVIAREENRGAQVSRNEGLAAASGEYVMFLDCDDYLEGPLLAGLVDAMQAEAADLGFAPMQVEAEGSGERRALFQPDYRSAAHLFESWFGRARFVAPCSVLWRTSHVRRIGGWDETIHKNQDGEIVLRAVLGGGRFALSSQGRGIYVDHPSAERITRRSDNMESPFDVAEKLLAIDSPVVDAATREAVCARRYYMLAGNCYYRGLDVLGDQALRRSRQLGFRGHQGSLPHRVASALLGLRRRYRLSRGLRRLVPVR
ncbi:glycosyltransferase family 2 protein [Sphingosinicella terrae]|uniref:glycosyltransferase family 2 protein n=1 Tax=Sphingosinicella terrae TaxID=2172047 RepID=UPI0013B37FF9|nr:glycosyltransferase family 2 protein [Sphingosinicella terrae]